MGRVCEAAAPPGCLVPARRPSPPLSHIVLKHMRTPVLSPQLSEHRFPKELFCFPARISTVIVMVMSSPPPNVSASPKCFLRGWYNQDPNGAHSCSRSARQSHPSASIHTCRLSPLAVYRGLAASPWVHQPLAGHALPLGGRSPSRAEPSRAEQAAFSSQLELSRPLALTCFHVSLAPSAGRFICHRDRAAPL